MHSLVLNIKHSSKPDEICLKYPNQLKLNFSYHTLVWVNHFTSKYMYKLK